MDSSPPTGTLDGKARNRLGQAGLLLGALAVALVAGMLAALRWAPYLQPPLTHIVILFVGLPIGGVVSLVGVILSVRGLGRPPRAGAWLGLALSLLALALVLMGYVFLAP
jgi:hypothetical protein